MASCCGGNGGALLLAKQFLDNMPMDANGLTQVSGIEANNQAVRMEYLGKQVGEISFFGLEGREYRGGNSTLFRYADVHPKDVDKLEATGRWRKVVVMPISEAPVETQELKIEQTMQAEPEPEPVKIEKLPQADQTQPKTKAKPKSKRGQAIGVTA